MPNTFTVVGSLADFGNDPRAGVKVRATATPAVKLGDAAVHSNGPEEAITDETGAFVLELVSIVGVWYRISNPGTSYMPVVNLAGYVADVDDPTTGTEYAQDHVVPLLDIVDEQPTPGYSGVVYIGEGGDASWSTITGKPSTFPPSAHTHPVDELEATGTPSSSTFLRGDGTWATPAGGGGGGAVDSVNGETGAVVLTAADVGAAPALGADDNYATDAEKVKLANLSGTNTGDQTLPTWSTIGGKPAVVAAGATQADARTAIGLGTAATTASTDYATAAQGAKADTALQPATGQTLNAQTGTTYTLVAADAGKIVTLSNASAVTVTLPQDSDATFAVGARVDFIGVGAGLVTFAAGTGATVNGTPSLSTRAQWSGATAVKRAANTWVVIGDLA